MKVFKLNDKNIPNGFSEQWSVSYEILEDNFWVKKESDVYCTFSKGRHKEVQKQFEVDMMGKHYKILKINYH